MIFQSEFSFHTAPQSRYCTCSGCSLHTQYCLSFPLYHHSSKELHISTRNRKKEQFLLLFGSAFNCQRTSYRYAFCPLCLMISYINMAAALLAFSELILPAIGIDTVKSHFSFTSLLIPLPSLPMTIAIGPLRSASV